MTYTITRPLMTAEELHAHKAEVHGRNFLLSDDGYDDMALNGRHGWRPVGGWGMDGWDLAEWPYVVISFREVEGRFELLSVCEGDHTRYTFATSEDRDAATDFLFLWYAAGKGLQCSIGEENRGRLDRGEIEVEDRFRGPYRSADDQGEDA